MNSDQEILNRMVFAGEFWKVVTKCVIFRIWTDQADVSSADFSAFWTQTINILLRSREGKEDLDLVCGGTYFQGVELSTRSFIMTLPRLTLKPLLINCH